MTPINPLTLRQAGFVQVNRNNVTYYQNGDMRVIYSGNYWHICDIDGNIGNTYVQSIEEIFAEYNRI